MYKTKTAWKVVSDPYAPESSWVPACASANRDECGPPPEGVVDPSERSTGRKVAEVVLLSSFLAVIGGAFAGQSVHVNYFAEHLIGSFLYNDIAFEQWGAFYYWFNQANAACTYIPLFFSYSMGFWASVYKFGKNFSLITAGSLALYLVTLSFFHPTFPFVNEPISYYELLLASGAAGSIAAFFLGKSIARNVAAIISPRIIYFATAVALFPMPLSFLGWNMQNYVLTASVCVSIPLAIGYIIRRMHSGSLKTSILLSITAASPLVLCGLMHLPVASWFGNALAESSTLSASFGRELFYISVLPLLALGLPVLGTLFGHAIHGVESVEDKLVGWVSTAEEVSPKHPMQLAEES
jgi:hypothetical protein